MKKQRLIILGSGPAGYTAAIYAARAKLQPLIISGEQLGGQLTTTTDVDNWPGEEQGIQGPALMEKMQKQALRFGTRLHQDHITQAQLKQKPIKLYGSATYTCDSLIIATGASAKYLGLASEKKYLGRGVSACATCDGFFFQNATVAVVGGGNTAIESALYLANIAKTVYLIHRSDQLRADKFMQNMLQQQISNGKIKNLWFNTVKEIIGDENKITALKLFNSQQQQNHELKVDGLFIAIGHTPNTEVFAGQLTMRDNYIQVKTGLSGNATATNIRGVFAAGDVVDSIYRQAVSSAGSGCMAALDAEKYLEQLKYAD